MSDRSEKIENQTLLTLKVLKSLENNSTYDLNEIKTCKEYFDSFQLNALQNVVIRVIYAVQKIFTNKQTCLSKLYHSNQGTLLLSRTCRQILKSSNSYSISDTVDQGLSMAAQKALSYLNYVRFTQLSELLTEFEGTSDQFDKKDLKRFFAKSPNFLKPLLRKLVKKQFGKFLDKHPQLLFQRKEQLPSVCEEVKKLVQLQAKSYLQLASVSENDVKESIKSIIRTNNKVFTTSFLSRNSVYDVSTEAVLKDISKDVLNKPITVTMVGIEYAGFAKEGGLAEAIEGMSQGLLEQNPENKVRLIFPKFSHLPKKVSEQLTTAVEHHLDGEVYKVYKLDHNGVECFFIEDPTFVLSENKPSIYGPDATAMSKRFSRFSELAADLITKHDDNDVIHIHDWHAAGVGLKLKNDNPQKWLEGKVPPIVFTFHNNNRVAQGRLFQGNDVRKNLSSFFLDKEILKAHENLFISAIATADSVTTVSETFGLEAQQYKFGEGVSFIVREAAKAGKLTGIINGVNLQRWNPETDASLMNWKDIDTQAPVKLSYGLDDSNIYETKTKAKVQLQKWLSKYMPHVKIDVTKPLVTFIGRFDSYQKGLDKLDEAIAATVKNGGQFIVMGMGEDPLATKILDELEKKYKKGVLFVRDYRDSRGRIYYQQGDETRPGVGSLIRACSDAIFAPSRFEPCGLVQFEGWLFGSLVIASNVGGLADTVISPEKDLENFNGFTFERDQRGDSSLTSVIKNALKFWTQKTNNQKTQVIQRIMRDGRQYGWHKSPRGLTPAEKYRLIYENARKFSQIRGVSNNHLYSANTVAREMPAKVGLLSEMYHYLGAGSKEEIYLKKLYKGQSSSEELEKAYQSIPEGSRASLPSPYGKNVNFETYKEYGAFVKDNQTHFNVYAPSAKSVEVHIYNDDETLELIKPLTLSANHSHFKAKIDENLNGKKYRLCINGKMKIDPYGRYQVPSKDQSLTPFSVVDSSEYKWNDETWLEVRKHQKDQSTPMNIYELHPSTWQRNASNDPLTYQQLAHKLVKHCKKMGYTHVEPMAILEHPYEGSMGYHVTGYFSPNHRHGSVSDFKEFVDILHQNGIGVVLDWVPAHFASDDYALQQFDGSKLYEASGLPHFLSIRKNFLSFGAKQFDFTKKEVREFLISSAAFWINEMHIDGLRVDCVRSILSSENQREALLFLRDLNTVIHTHGKGAISIAEDYSGSDKVTQSFWKEGLGFDYKWHVGLVHAIIEHSQSKLKGRSSKYGALKKAMLHDQSNNQITYLSHDNLFGNSLLDFIKNTPEKQRSSALKSLLSLTLTAPGKKLIFMGADEGVTSSWKASFDKLSGYLNDDTLKDKHIINLVSRLTKLYRSYQENWEFDQNGKDLEWIEDKKKGIHAYRRKSSEGSSSSVFHNTTIGSRTIRVPIENSKNLVLEEIFNSDSSEFGGQNRVNQHLVLEKSDVDNKSYYTVNVPPLSSIIIKER